MKYFEFGTENPECMVLLHGGGTSYRGIRQRKSALLIPAYGCRDDV